MEKPGESVRQDKEYRDQLAEKRTYWQGGANNTLSEAQRDKLEEQADRAARYRRGDDDYNGDYPREFDGPIPMGIDHGRLVRNIKQYVKDGFKPKDTLNKQSPPRPLSHMLDTCPTPENPVPPPDGATSGEPNWVCINVAEYTAALLRVLGYPVRETNAYLSQGGAYTYQSAAIQVWFDGGWHWVDPYSCNFDPQTWVQGSFTDMNCVYWDGTVPVPSRWWIPEANDYLDSSFEGGYVPWEELDDDEIGNDLQERFYPRLLTSSGGAIKQAKYPSVHYPGKFEKRVYVSTPRARAQRSGVIISTYAEGVELYLVDSAGRTTDGRVNEIPGAIRMAKGTPILYSRQVWRDPKDPNGPSDTDYPSCHEKEWVFFGTEKIEAAWPEIGRHELTLYIRARADLPSCDVALDYQLLCGEHPVTVDGIPPRVSLVDGISAIKFQVTIDPVDASFHVIFDLLVRNGMLVPNQYGHAADSLHAMCHRAERYYGRCIEQPDRNKTSKDSAT